MDIRLPEYHVNQTVKCIIDLFNDGTFPEKSESELLVKKDTEGVIVQTGMHEESQTPIYMVDFANSIVIGVFEEEITPARA